VKNANAQQDNDLRTAMYCFQQFEFVDANSVRHARIVNVQSLGY
jgi:hypothetical protein